jgi:hypothetical protein
MEYNVCKSDLSPGIGHSVSGIWDPISERYSTKATSPSFDGQSVDSDANSEWYRDRWPVKKLVKTLIWLSHRPSSCI